VPRFLKFLSLAVYFNSVPAALGSAAVLIITLSVTSLLPLPVIVFDSHTQAIVSRIFCIPIFLCVLFWYRDVCHALGIQGCLAFLDKTCIHQVDKAIQRLGIEKLGAYLYGSKAMIILYTDSYLQKLWTVYELATFLAVKPLNKLHVVPVLLPMVWIIGLLIMYASGLVALLIATGYKFASGVLIGGLVPSILFVPALRRWAHDLERIPQRLANFTCDGLLCMYEDDRRLVYGNIVELMKAAGLVETTASEAQALHAFELMVQNLLPAALAIRVGRVGFSYSMPATLAIALLLPWFVDSIAGLPPWRFVVRRASMLIGHALGTIPLLIAVWMWLARHWLQLSGCKEYVFLFVIWAAGIIMSTVMMGCLQMLSTWAKDSDLWLGVLLFSACMLAALGMITYRKK